MYASRLDPFITSAVTAAACDVNVACLKLAWRSSVVGDLPNTTSDCIAASVLSTASRSVMVSSCRGMKLAAHVLSDCRVRGPNGMLPVTLPARH